MPLRLRVIPPSSRQSASSGDAAEHAIDFDDGIGQIRIGRRADLELSLPYSPLSGVHARLVRASDNVDKTDRWLLEDLGSTNGTFVGGERLKPGVKLAVTAGTQIKVAEVQLIFDGQVRLEGGAAAAPEGANKPAGRGEGSTKTRVQGEPPDKVQGEASNKVTGKTPSEVPSKSTGKVQGEASHKATGKTASEVSSKSGKVQAEVSNKATGKTASEVSKSGGKVPLNDPTQTYVRRQFTDVFSSGPAGAQVPFLTAVAGIAEGDTTFRLEQREHVYMFGRTRRCEFRVNGTDVSREHASFVRRGDGVYVNDLGSVNGVLVNNTRVKDYRLYDGDLIQIGHVKLRLFDPSEPSPRESERPAGSNPLSRSTPSRSAPSHGALSFGAANDAHAHVEPPSRSYEAPPVRADAAGAFPDLHPAVAGQLAAEGTGYRRRPSVRVRIQESWETSSGFRYAIVIVAASILAVCAVIVGFSLAG
jgi:pSer/pThr/pTyr-binding forkhead associated (FHA) protein